MGTALDEREIQEVVGGLPRRSRYAPTKDVVEGFVYDTAVGAHVTQHPRRAAVIAVRSTWVVLKCYCGRLYKVKKKDKYGWFACSAKCALRWYPDRTAALIKARKIQAVMRQEHWDRIPSKQKAWLIGYWRGVDAATKRYLNVLKGLAHVLTVSTSPQTTLPPRRRKSADHEPPTPLPQLNPYWPPRDGSPLASPSDTSADDTRS